MNARLKKVLSTGLVMLGIGVIAGRAHASGTDTMTVSVTPNVTYSVAITSPYASGYNFGTVSLAATTVSTLAIVLNATGATAAEYFGLAISNTSGGWTATTSPTGADTFRMAAIVTTGGQPSTGTFTGASNYLSTSFSGAAYNLYTQTSRTVPAGSTNLWLRLETPTQITTGGTGQQTMTLTATASAT